MVSREMTDASLLTLLRSAANILPQMHGIIEKQGKTGVARNRSGEEILC